MSSCHEGVSCDSCVKQNFRGRRYKCLICLDFDLCAECYESGAVTSSHTTAHPMQCILTRLDLEIFYGGENYNSDIPQAYTCPLCGNLGFTEKLLYEHVTQKHDSDPPCEVMCPICASMPVIDINCATEDFAIHLSLEHKRQPELYTDENRRGRVLQRGNATRSRVSRGVILQQLNNSSRMYTMNESSVPITTSSQVDSIAELLSQLSTARRSPGNSSSHLHHLQNILQLERTQTRVRRTFEFLPKRTATAPQLLGTNPSSAFSSDINEKKLNTKKENSKFALNSIFENVKSEEQLEKEEQERADRSLFVQELLLSTM